MNVMVLKPLWEKIFNPYERNMIYRPKDYALVCIDIYSQYVWAVAMDDETYDSIAAAMLKILGHMERPKILQGDQKIIEAFEKFLTSYNLGISLTMTKPHETNKNAIVERAIKTLKNDLLKYLYFNPFPIASGQLDTISQVLQEVCLLRNLTVHRMIEEKPFDVFYGRKPNRQIIVRKTYPQYKKGDLVLVKPIRERGLIKTKIFEFDYNIYIILDKEGDKYRIKSLYNFVHEINKVKKQWFKPYELRAISPRQALKHLNSPLVWQYLRKQYGDIAGLEKVKEHFQSLL
jgi:hypothetical protein